MQEIIQIKKYLNTQFIERKPIVDGLLMTTLTNKNMFVFGPPGTAKSELVHDFADLMAGGGFFYKLMSSFSNPQELLGSLDMKALEEGVHKHDTTNMLPECRFAFLDEIFKSNSGCLNALLDIANEGHFRNGREIQEAKTEVIIGASNEVPGDESLMAFYDRFPLRFNVPYLPPGDKFKKLLLRNTSNPRPQAIDEETLKEARSRVEEIEITQQVVDVVDQIRAFMLTSGVGMSDRSWMTSLNFLKASAFLGGRDTIDIADFNIYCNMLWNYPEQEQETGKKVKEFIKTNSFAFIVAPNVANSSTQNVSSNNTGLGRSIQSAMTRMNNTARNCHKKDTQPSTIMKIKQDIIHLYQHMNASDRNKAQDLIKEINDALTQKNRDSELIDIPALQQQAMAQPSPN